MSEVVKRLRAEVEAIARSESPSLTFTAVSAEGLPHSATVWFAPTDELNLLTFSAPTRIHARLIDSYDKAQQLALVSGGMRSDGQKKSHPDQHGLTFEGTADRLHDPRQIEPAIARFLVYKTFEAQEIDRYLNHPTAEVPSHGVYVIRPRLWTIFDGRLGSNNPDRLIHLNWPVAK